MRHVCGLLVVLSLPFVSMIASGCAGGERRGFWIDLYRGEPVPYEDILEDLKGVRVVYVGETHTLQRHHQWQERIVTDLTDRGTPLVLALEQMEYHHQPALDRYASSEIDFDKLVRDTDWAKHWSNYEQYRAILEAARRAGAPILALNARAKTIRRVGKEGLEALDADTREELPPEINLDDPMQEERLRKVMMVHAMVQEDRLRKMFEAQVSRDETMAHRLAEFLNSKRGEGLTAVVILGSGHASHGLGTPVRVRRRMPGVKDRILILTESGDLELSPKMRAMMRDITITHEQLRHLDKPYADYLHATSAKPQESEQ